MIKKYRRYSSKDKEEKKPKVSSCNNIRWSDEFWVTTHALSSTRGGRPV